eukprot:CAMPEP_0172019414 /NCGR_PEP_ID=MMETSP1041-20130122/12624_1 /TAXON_ID=464988 /ORGANISM="Hemiselmis andersenii, Strain CCMP439" /LENGTH=307 /DNA_ID=CAMNT_0012674587 /DNA_START=214 /DNA_END=1137 /DNA_ORIENTATION=+
MAREAGDAAHWGSVCVGINVRMHRRHHHARPLWRRGRVVEVHGAGLRATRHCVRPIDVPVPSGEPPLADGPGGGGKVAPLDHGPHEVASIGHLTGLFSSRLIKSTVFITVAYTVCGFVYYGHIFIYPILLEEEYHMEVREAYGTMMIGVVVEIATVLACMVIMDVPGIGRRGAMASGFVACFVVACLVTLSQNVSQFVFLNSAVRALIEGPFTVIYIYAGELLPSSHRATGISFCNSFGRIAAMGAPVVTTWAEENSIIVVFGLFAGAAGLGTLAIILFKRETLGKPLVELVEDLEDDEDEEKKPLL